MGRLACYVFVVSFTLGCPGSEPALDAGAPGLPEVGHSADIGVDHDAGQQLADAGITDVASPTDGGEHVDAGPHRCGDGRVRPDRHPTDADYEECDDGNSEADDMCTNACRYRVIDMVALNYSTCALLANGRVYCRGYNGDRSLGLGEQQQTRSIDGWRRPRGLGDVVQIDGGRDWVCGRHANGQVSCWGLGSYSRSNNGDNIMYQPRIMPDINDAQDLALGTHSACFINGARQVYCWGRNRYGELGDGTIDQRRSPVRVAGLDNVVAIDIESYHACAVDQAGLVWCWGNSNNRRMGSDSHSGNQLQPIQVPGVAGAVDVDVSGYGACARLGDGTAMCWGINWNGQSGLPVSSPLDPTALPEMSQVTKFALENLSGCAIAGETAQVSCWGLNHFGQTGDPSTKQTDTGPRALEGVSDAIGLTLGVFHGCAWTAQGRRFCWGLNSFGQLGTGIGAALTIREPRKVEDQENITQISAGASHFCSLDQQGAARCWGANGYGQLGDGTTLASNRPQLVSSLGAVRQITAGRDFSCAVLMDGTGKCWGFNRNGQLGIDSGEDQISPTAIQGPAMQVIRAGDAFACGLDPVGAVYCWGYGSEGSLGLGNRNSRRSPNLVPNLPAIQDFALSYRHVCAVTGSGQVFCWGRNNSGQTGQARNVTRVTSPFQVMVGNALDVSVGRKHSCALTANEGVWCWGLNSSGQLGIDDFDLRVTPTRVGTLTNVTGVFGWRFGYGTCATTDRLGGEQGVYCWGQGFWGQTGAGEFRSLKTPQLIDTSTALGGRLQTISANDRQICAVGQNGGLACWGDPTQGRTGHGSVDPMNMAPNEVIAFTR